METKEQVKEVLTKVKEGIQEQFDSESLVSDGILDSLDIMNLIMALEDGFGIEINPEDVLSDNFESVDAISKLVDKCKG